METTEIQAKSKLDHEILQLSAEKEHEELQIADECACHEHDHYMIDRQIELARLQQHLAIPTVQVLAAPAPRLYDGVNGIDPALFHSFQLTVAAPSNIHIYHCPWYDSNSLCLSCSRLIRPANRFIASSDPS